MKPAKQIRTLTDLWRWLESRFQEVSLKLDHVLFRLREQDPRIPHLNVVDCSADTEEQSDETTDI